MAVKKPAKLDHAKFSFSDEQIRDVNELIKEELLEAPDLQFFHTLYPGIIAGKEIGFIGEGGLVGKKGQGCDPTTQDWRIGTRKLVWQPKTWEVYLDECADDLSNTMIVYCMKNSVEMHDLTNTDYMAVIVEVLVKAIKKMIYRLVWFGDEDALNYAPNGGGNITVGVDTEYFIVMNGYWKQIMGAITGNPRQRISIAANGEATADLQASALTPEMAYKTLSDMHFKSPSSLRQSSTARYLCTQSFADAYQLYLEGLKLESTYTNLIDGVKALKFRGIDVIPLPIFDEMIFSFHVTGDKLFNPHRVLFIEKENLAIGTPTGNVLDELDIWYERKERKNYMLAKDKMDPLLLDGRRLMLGM